VKELAASLHPWYAFSDGLENLQFNLIARLIHDPKIAANHYRPGISIQVGYALFNEQPMQGVVVSQPYK